MKKHAPQHRRIFEAMWGSLARWLSHVWPVRVWRGRGRHGELELTWEYGRLVVNSAHANQSFGSLHRVWRAAFTHARIAERNPVSTLILGFGAGSAARILREELHLRGVITGVDDDQVMLELARTRFPIREGPPAELIQADAFAFVVDCRTHFDLIVVDLFHDLDFAAGVESPQFLAAIRRLSSPGGVLLVNTVVHDEKSAARSARLRDELRLHFTNVQEQHYEGNNRVYIAL